jgi:spore coat polysaccharide biosynthesis protein SpsF
MGSTRLPGKVMMDVAGVPMLARVVNRLKRAKCLDEVIVATTENRHDDVIERLAAQANWVLFRGSEDDVLDRYYQAAVSGRADAVVRITSDCPLIDPFLVDRVIQLFVSLKHEVDYVSNSLPSPTFPRGLDTEVFSFGALERAWREDLNPAGESTSPLASCGTQSDSGLEDSSTRQIIPTFDGQ